MVTTEPTAALLFPRDRFRPAAPCTFHLYGKMKATICLRCDSPVFPVLKKCSQCPLWSGARLQRFLFASEGINTRNHCFAPYLISQSRGSSHMWRRRLAEVQSEFQNNHDRGRQNAGSECTTSQTLTQCECTVAGRFIRLPATGTV